MEKNLDIHKKEISAMIENDFLLESIPSDSLEEIIQFSLDYGLLSDKDLLYRIKCMIDSSLPKAKSMMQWIDKNHYNSEYSYLEKLMEEKERYLSYGEELKRDYNKCIAYGKSALNKHNYSLAYNVFATGFSRTHDAIFKYYMGKALFKARDRENAICLFEDYLKYGGSKTTKSLVYLMSINGFFGREEIAHKYYDEMIHLTTIFNPEYKTYPFPGIKKDKHKIDITIDDYNQYNHKNLNLESYYDYSFKDKISLLEKLFNDGQYSVAIKLFNELKPADKAQRKLTENIVKNKTLYRNKRSK